MSKRLQVVFDDAEYEQLQKLARSRGMTVSDWVRHSLKLAKSEVSGLGIARKLDVLRAAVSHSYPTADIDVMNEQIERGYLAE